MVCKTKHDLINSAGGIISTGGLGMEQAIMKGAALFATLIGIYNWLGQGASFFDILIIFLATALIITTDAEKHEVIAPTETGDNLKKSNFFLQKVIPLSEMFALSVRHFYLKQPFLQPLYSFSC